MSKLLVMSSMVTLALLGCGDDHGEESFDNLPECVVDHASLGEAQAIAHCLVDFPELHPSFADLQECVDWVADNGGYEATRETACADYFQEIGS